MIAKHDAELALSRAMRTGADFAELFVEDVESGAIKLLDSRIEGANRARTRGAGIRVFRGVETAYAYTNDLTAKGLAAAAEAAAAALGAAGEAPRISLVRGVAPNRHPILRLPADVPGKRRAELLRSADAAGVDGFIICNKCTDIYNPNVIRASTGALFSVPLAEAENQEAYDWLKRNNIKTLAATPHTDRIYTDADMTQAVAIVVGTEQTGLTELWMEHSDLPVRIPMLGRIDSLNVATATTILLYEAARQRNWKTSF